jgi:hypothetical protein
VDTFELLDGPDDVRVGLTDHHNRRAIGQVGATDACVPVREPRAPPATPFNASSACRADKNDAPITECDACTTNAVGHSALHTRSNFRCPSPNCFTDR